jgi:hypothetical protein
MPNVCILRIVTIKDDADDPRRAAGPQAGTADHQRGRWDAGKVEPIPSFCQLRRLHDGIADSDVQMEFGEDPARDILDRARCP